jgi:hypothetical protein
LRRDCVRIELSLKNITSTRSVSNVKPNYFRCLSGELLDGEETYIFRNALSKKYAVKVRLTA